MQAKTAIQTKRKAPARPSVRAKSPQRSRTPHGTSGDNNTSRSDPRNGEGGLLAEVKANTTQQRQRDSSSSQRQRQRPKGKDGDVRKGKPMAPKRIVTDPRRTSLLAKADSSNIARTRSAPRSSRTCGAETGTNTLKSVSSFKQTNVSTRVRTELFPRVQPNGRGQHQDSVLSSDAVQTAHQKGTQELNRSTNEPPSRPTVPNSDEDEILDERQSNGHGVAHSVGTAKSFEDPKERASDSGSRIPRSFNKSPDIRALFPSRSQSQGHIRPRSVSTSAARTSAPVGIGLSRYGNKNSGSRINVLTFKTNANASASTNSASSTMELISSSSSNNINRETSGSTRTRFLNHSTSNSGSVTSLFDARNAPTPNEPRTRGYVTAHAHMLTPPRLRPQPHMKSLQSDSAFATAPRVSITSPSSVNSATSTSSFFQKLENGRFVPAGIGI